MEFKHLVATLRTLSTHLRPDAAKVLLAYADALEASGAKHLAAQMVQSQCSKRPQQAALVRTVELLTLLAALGDAAGLVDREHAASALAAAGRDYEKLAWLRGPGCC